MTWSAGLLAVTRNSAKSAPPSQLWVAPAVVRFSCECSGVNQPAPLPNPFDRQAFTTRTANAAGIPRSRLRAADLASPFKGTRVPASIPLTLATRCRALQLRLPGAHFSGPTAALLHGAPIPLALEKSPTLHVTVRDGRRAPTGQHIRGHQLRFEPSDVRFLHGVRVSTPARLWCELGSVLSVPDLVAVGDYLVHRRDPLTTSAELAHAVTTYPGRRDLKRLREALPLLSDRAESRQESRVRVILTQGGIGGFRVNHWVTASNGKRYRVDVAFPTARLALEYQGDHHRDQAQYRKDVSRRAHLEADRWTVLEVAADDVGPELVDIVRARLSLL